MSQACGEVMSWTNIWVMIIKGSKSWTFIKQVMDIKKIYNNNNTIDNGSDWESIKQRLATIIIAG